MSRDQLAAHVGALSADIDVELAVQVALADALDRTLPHAVQVIPRTSEDDQGFVAAQAG